MSKNPPPLEITFAASGVTIEAKATKPARITAVAYGGGILAVSHGPTVVDLAGLAIPPSVPLLADHDNRIDSVAGVGHAAVQAGRLLLDGTISRNSTAGGKILALHGDGVSLKVSIGVAIEAAKRLADGETIDANGRQHVAPRGGLLVVTAGRLQEISIVPIPADATTEVAIAASKGSPTMSDNPNNDAAEAVATLRSEIATEKRRIAAIETIAAKYEGNDKIDAATAVADGWSAERFELHAMKATERSAPRAAGGPKRLPTGQQIEGILLAKAGAIDVVSQQFGEQAAETCRAMATRTSLLDLCEMSVRAAGHEPPEDREKLMKAAFVQAAMGPSTYSLPDHLANVAHKMAMADYQQSVATWRSWVRTETVQDFKSHSLLRLHLDEGLAEVGKDGELQSTSLSGQKYEFSVDTFGRVVVLSRQDLINDDLSAFSRIGQSFGNLALRHLSDQLYTKLFDGETLGFFASGNNNLLEGGSDLDAASLSLAIQRLREMKSPNGDDITIVPRVLIVSPALEQTARALLNSQELSRVSTGDDLPTGNPFGSLNLTLEVEPRLSNTTKFPATAAANWYLAGSPADTPMILATLGSGGPTVEQREAPPEQLGVVWRVYIDSGVAFGDHRAIIKATGAA